MKSKETQMFKVVDGEAIRFSSARVATLPDGPGERGEGVIKRALPKELPSDFPGCRGGCMWCEGGKLLVDCYSLKGSEDRVESLKVMD